MEKCLFAQDTVGGEEGMKPIDTVVSRHCTVARGAKERYQKWTRVDM